MLAPKEQHFDADEHPSQNRFHKDRATLGWVGIERNEPHDSIGSRGLELIWSRKESWAMFHPWSMSFPEPPDGLGPGTSLSRIPGHGDAAATVVRFACRQRGGHRSLRGRVAPLAGTSAAPLAARMRPRTLEDYAGQTHLLAPGQLLRRAIEADRIQSLILYGPPGTGKTSLAQIISGRSRARFERLSGVESNVSDIRRVLAGASNRLSNTGQATLLFIDEIHRFNKSQQDVLCPTSKVAW